MQFPPDIPPQLIELGALYGVRVLTALVILLVGRIAAGLIRRVIVKLMKRGDTDPMVIGFVGNLAYVGMLAFVIMAALDRLGIETTSFIAVLGAAGLAIGLALQGSLSNFASGFLLIIFRPFSVGDFIEGAGVSGIVERIHMFTTTLRTGDNKTVIIPNSKLSDDNIVNYSAKDTRRVDLIVGASYEADIKHVKAVLEGLISSDDRILSDPASLVAVGELGDSSVNFVVRVWVKTEDYWGVFFDLTEQVKLRFDEEKIGIPYPTQDVNVFQQKTA